VEDTFKISNDPHLEERIVDVVGLYLDPPEKAVVLSFDERRSARPSTAPSRACQCDGAGPRDLLFGVLKMQLEHVQRNGTTDLFAALNIATGDVITECRKHHTAVDVLTFFKRVDRSVPRKLEVHIVLDNLSAHKAPEVRLADPRRARWHLHLTPTSSSWLNLVERGSWS